ncbi:MAG: hypothetical protein ACYCSN_03880 [Acidobacteriaceae bacterium]
MTSTISATLEQTQAQINPDQQEVAAGRERENLEGWIPSLATDAEVYVALEKAFDYRGDITLTKKDGSKLEGYLYDRQAGKTLADSYVKLMPTAAAAKAGERVKIKVAYSEIAAIAFTGSDRAAGKRFEDWVKNYMEKKAAGEKNIQIEPEKLD